MRATPRQAITVLGVALAGALAASGYLWRENRRLGDQLAASRTEIVAVRQAASAPVVVADDDASDDKKARRRTPLGVLAGLGRALAGPPDPAAPGEVQKEETDEEKRQRRQRRLKDMLGRRDGESDEEYRARVAPLVELGLSGPRERVDERRRQFEEAAGVTDEQQAQLDQAFAEAEGELLALANQSIGSGDLTPYRRNTKGILSFVASTVTTVDALEGRLGGILTDDQLATMEESGFDWLEYLGLTAPWETLNPPPPEPKPGM